MPARRQHRRGDRLTLKERETARRVVASQPRNDIDHEWREHQEWERMRRAPQLLRPPPFDIWPVLTAVLADFARWRGER